MLKFHALQLRSRTALAEDAVLLTLAVPPAFASEFHAEPGQHVVLRAGPAGSELRRTYSVLPSPAGELKLAVRVQGDLSRHLASGVAVGDAIDAMPPNGRHHRVTDAGGAKRYLALAAGSGITPVLAVVTAILEREPAASVVLLYGNRSIGRAMCVEDVLALKNRFLDRLVVHFLMSREPQEVELFNGRIDVARLAALTPGVLQPAAFDEAFVCLPGRSGEDIAAWLEAQGMTGRVHIEHFAIDAADAAPTKAVVAPAAATAAAPAATAGAEITVILDGRRRSFTMPFDGDSVLDAAAAAGIDLPFSCKDGICSTCRTRVVEGSVEMTQNYALEDWEVEAGFVLCCQARPKTPRVSISYDEK
jgi:ring-1,2-phenylacetyl-CoA epoxidase subunit PaaE